MMRDFVILGGWHRSVLFNWYPFLSNKITLKVRFNGSNFHANPLGYIHKAVGFSDGGMKHHKNSFRIGWTADEQDEFITLYVYTYVDGIRHIYPLMDVAPGRETIFDVSIRKGFYRVIVEGKILEYPRSLKIRSNYKNILYPYFGGKIKAPHNMWIEVNWKTK